MTESVKVSKSRISLKKFGLQSGETPYLVRRERAGTESNPIRSFGTIAAKTGHELSVSYPSTQRLLDSQKEWIRQDIGKFERALYSHLFADPHIGYAAYIDVGSFVDYYIINEFAMILDAGYLSTYVYKDLGGKLKMTVWDFNNGFDNYQWRAVAANELTVAENNWFARLFEDRSFAQAVIGRYRELREGILSNDSLLAQIDKEAAYLAGAVERNFAVWGYTFYESLLSKSQDGLRRDPRSYQEALQQLKDCIVARGTFLDTNIEALYQFAKN